MDDSAVFDARQNNDGYKMKLKVTHQNVSFKTYNQAKISTFFSNSAKLVYNDVPHIGRCCQVVVVINFKMELQYFGNFGRLLLISQHLSKHYI